MTTRWAPILFVLLCCLLAVPDVCGSQSCPNHEQIRLPSPDGSRELVLFLRLCGSAYAHEVAIVAKGAALPDGPGNVPLPDHPTKVVARWVTAESVILASPTAGQSPQEFRVAGVTVRYVRQ